MLLQSAKKRLDRCMFRMFQDFPFWAFLIERCNVKLTEDAKRVPTACIDRKGNIYLNREFFNSLSDTMMHFVLAHEVMHMLLDHHSRQGGRQKFLWNVAGDILINGMLEDHFAEKSTRLDLTPYITSSSFSLENEIDHNTATTEEVYDLILKNNPPEKKKEDGLSVEGGIQGGTDLADFEPGDDPDGENIRAASEGTPQNAKEWADAGLEAATRSRMAGNCPAFMERHIDKLLNPEIAWNEVLAYYLRNKFCMKSKSRHTFTPPNRRYLYQDMILTSRIGKKKPSIAFSVDTSGSMSEQDISKGIAEMDAIRKMYRVPVYLLEADYTVHRAKWVEPNEEIPSLKGGGGTSFVPVINHLKENKPDVDVLVYFTDGYGEFGENPEFDVIWVVNSSVQPPYGKTIRINTE
jgi:predicted metal-dependent peptidase